LHYALYDVEFSAEAKYCIDLNILKVIQLNLCIKAGVFLKQNFKNNKHFKNETHHPNHKLHNNENAYYV